ncbi:hypothetical protein HYR69_00180, partial [Candidatus Sumerlaeota bacterium]|nr:hypothetical protein [Candidatus Sumerlaeota bacterium]
GQCISGDELHISTWPVRVKDGCVYVLLPRADELDAASHGDCARTVCAQI